MSDVVIKFSQVGADGVTRVFEAQNLSIEAQSQLLRQSFNAAKQAEGGMTSLGTGGLKALDMVRDGVRDLVSDLAGVRLPSFNGGVAGFALEAAGTVFDIARQEEARKRAQQEATRIAALPVAERRREVIMNLPDDETLNAGNIDATMAGISTRTGTELNKVQGAMVPAFSATGALSTDFAAKAVERGFTRMPNNEQFAVDYAGRLLDLMNVEHAAGRSTDDDKFDQIEGALLSTQSASRVKSATKMAQTAVPLAKAMSQTGDSTERSFEYFAAVSNAIADEQGDKTRTLMAGVASHLAGTQRALPSLSKQLAGVAPEDVAAFASATNTDERLAALHKSPALFQALDKAKQFNFGEADTKEVIRGMLQGDEKFQGQLTAASGKVVWGDAAKGFLGRKMSDMAAGPQQNILDIEQQSTSAANRHDLSQTLAQRNAALRKVVDDTLERTEAGWLDRKVLGLENRIDWDEENPELSAERRLRANEGALNVGGNALDRERQKADRELIAAQIAAIKQLQETLAKNNADLKANTAATARNTTASGGVETPPPAPSSEGLTLAP